MASVAVMAAVEARVATYWTASDVFTPNTVGETPVDGTPFLSVQYPVANNEQISVGSPGAEVFREEGGIRFVFSIPRGQGISYYQSLLEALMDHFRAKQFSSVTTFAPSAAFTDDSSDVGNYWLLTSVVPYQLNILG